MRYDAGWVRYRPDRQYDRAFRYDDGYVRGGEPPLMPPSRFDEVAILRQPEVYGPARYGLGPYHERLRRRRRSDEELREDVEEALFYDTWVDADAITVEVEDGIVTLRGALPNYEEIRFATDDAWDIDGVVGVRTDLRVSER